ncbi:hypothetical protein IQ254_02190 [Nodosilinea sp. LEGE 07088]|nr:hypothetical protein [Nodosilinea sp. LEGE 07088]
MARRYLEHAIAPNTPLATAVRLRMHGQIKLKAWSPFRAEQVIYPQRGLIWQATAWVQGLPILGSDRLVDGDGAMRWKLLGLMPVMVADGPDMTRSAIGRLLGEQIWLPSALLKPGVIWSDLSETQTQASVSYGAETTNLILTVDVAGRLQSISFNRWGNPDDTEHRYVAFGGYMEQESTFGGYTIPTQFRVGWYFGGDSLPETRRDRFESEGEFFRATLDSAQYQ